MKDTLISFTVAKLAKEKGFDWKVLTHYRNGGLYNKELIQGGSLYNMNDKEEQVLWNTNLYSAPTQSLLQKWLREKHNKYVQCHPVYRDEKIQWEYIIFFLDEPLLSGTDGFKNRMSLLNHPYYWETYEEALEAGLYDTLKLINNDSKTEQ